MIHGLDSTPATLADLDRHIARVEAILAKPATGTAGMQRNLRESQLRSLKRARARAVAAHLTREGV